MTDLSETYFEDDMTNPLDGAEEILLAPDFLLNRANRDELFVEARGRYSTYRMMFVWDEAMGALQFCCEYGLQVADLNQAQAARTVVNINSGLWLGHFDLPPETLSPTFRYTQLFRGMNASGADHVQDLIRIAIDECDRHYPVFISLSQNSAPDADDLALAMVPVQGQA